MSQKQTLTSLKKALELFPESVLLKWINSGYKAHLRLIASQKGTNLEALANKKLKLYTPESLQKLRTKLLK